MPAHLGFWSAGATPFAFLGSSSAIGRGYTPTVTGNAGEIHVVIVVGTNGNDTPAAPETPTGWTPITSEAGSDFQTPSFNCQMKLINSADNSNVNFLGSGNIENIIGVLRFTGPLTFNTALLESSGFTSENPGGQTKSISAKTRPVLVVAGYSEKTNNSIGNFNTAFSPTEDNQVARSVTIAATPQYHMAFRLKFKVYNTLPADTSVDLDDNGPANLLFSFIIE